MKNFIFSLTMIFLLSQCSSLKPIETENPKINVNDNTINLRKALVDYARKQVGVKYKYGGTSPNGFDCSGFTQFVFKIHNIDLPHNSGAQSQVGEKVKSENIQPGDLVFFKKGRKVNHVGLVTKIENGNVYMIHSSSSRGIIEESITSSTYWKPKLLYYRNYINE